MNKILILLALVFPTFHGAAYAFPDKMFEIVVPTRSGGDIDAVARMIQHILSNELGMPARVSNLGGGVGEEALTYMEREVTDPHTFLVTPIYQNYLDRLRIVKTIYSEQWLIFTGRDSRISRELDITKRQNLSLAGPKRGVQRLSAVLEERYKSKIVHNYMNSNDTFSNTIQGAVDMGITRLRYASEDISSENIIPIAVTGLTRSAFYPAIPTAGELKLDFVLEDYIGIAISKNSEGNDSITDLIEILERVIESSSYLDYTKQRQLEVSDMGTDDLFNRLETVNVGLCKTCDCKDSDCKKSCKKCK